MNKNQDKNLKIIVKEVKDYIPSENSFTQVCISGNIIELKVRDKNIFNNLQYTKRINKNQYLDIRTNEVKNYDNKKSKENSIRNMNRSFEKLRQLINANFTGEINERHITLTYAEKMTDYCNASIDFKRFWEKLHYHYPDLEFIRIIEPQETGSWHIHALLKTKKYRNLSISIKQIEKLWGHGFVRKTTTLGCDNVGAYFTAFLKNSTLEFECEENETSKKASRLSFYPPNKRLYGKSKGIIKPITFNTTYGEALKLVDEKQLVFSKTNEINIVYENKNEQFTINRISRYQFNKKKNIKGE